MYMYIFASSSYQVSMPTCQFGQMGLKQMVMRKNHLPKWLTMALSLRATRRVPKRRRIPKRRVKSKTPRLKLIDFGCLSLATSHLWLLEIRSTG